MNVLGIGFHTLGDSKMYHVRSHLWNACYVISLLRDVQNCRVILLLKINNELQLYY